ncbi:C4-dicarboxylate ABC transporter [Pseudomonas daroniae]|uniref:C4-dicarboxylate ABC transporter n=1 Tax=Phytopseudomonas daroniae TaxID=2487519 RepID=A0A4Q9QM76_9GAMM|nr:MULTISPECIES: TRAP transporter substrate-binding protein [Pseudomonas]TBU80696.1 C4-dicarboxylate ABC transporter [Pseudomonas daroniae]TBU81731.1 C4-dicarboxylate ABC transporter [Pseudomonas sp. FRB 228]TBU90867.1 C4-dicarboxylate ABC transporter [Pseudomonas daroniae]
MKLRRTLLSTAFPLALLIPSLSDAITLQVADTQPKGYPAITAIEHMGEKLSTATNGEITMRVFAGGVLGGEKEAIEQAQINAIQLTRVSLGVVGPVVPDVNVFNMPFVFRDSAHMRKVIDGEIGQEILDKITNSTFELVGLAWMDAGSRNFYSKEPIRTLADLKGKKMRMMENPLFLDTMNALGGSGIAMGTGETFSALQSGVIDGAENNPAVMLAQNHQQVAKYFSETSHLIIPEPLVMSKKAWEALSAEQQTLVRKFAREAQMEQRALWDIQVAQSEEKLKAAGVEFIQVDRKPFYEATAAVRDKYGAPYAALIERIEAVQ